LADGENDLPFDNGMDVSMDSTSSLSGSTSDADNDNDGKSSNDEDDDDDGVGMGEANINTSKSGIPNSVSKSNWCVHERHQKVVCECNYKQKTGVRGGKQSGVHEVTSNPMGVRVLIWLVQVIVHVKVSCVSTLLFMWGWFSTCTC